MLKLGFIHRIKFFVERQFIKGASFQLLAVMLLIGFISLFAGALVAWSGDQFEDLSSAVWWAFLRLSDPGYLGDDEGTWVRFVSTLLTVSGYVLFLGTLVAIMTRKLIEVMNNLERGLTPVFIKNHIVVLGWTSRTLPLLREILSASRLVQRFLKRNTSSRRLQLVVLSETASAAQRQELANEAGIGRRARQIILRGGSSIQPDALKRVACLDAAAIILPSNPQGPASEVAADVETLKAMLTIAAQARELAKPLPFMVVELQDIRKLAVAKRAYPGPLEVIAGDATISRLMTQNLLHPGLSGVYNELLTAAEGNEIYVRSGEAMSGYSLEDLACKCPEALVLGLLKPSPTGWKVMLLADSATVIAAEDRIILMAREYDATQPTSDAALCLPAVSRQLVKKPEEPAPINSHKVLILGWNQRVPSLLAEFSSYSGLTFKVDLMSLLPAKIRKAELRGYLPQQDEHSSLQYQLLEADYMVEAELRRLALQSYDTILLLSSDRLASGEEADARALVGQLQLETLLSELDHQPQVILELSDPNNQALLNLPHTEVLVSPIILSHLLAQVALRRELKVVFDELFTVGGAEILFQEQIAYFLPEDADFHQLEKAVAEKGEIALGIYRSQAVQGRRLFLNPERKAKLNLAADDQVVVIALS